jgi:hypothetical protein
MVSINKHPFDVIRLLRVEVTIKGVINLEDPDVFGIAPWDEDMLLDKFVKLIFVSRLGLLALKGLGTCEENVYKAILARAICFIESHISAILQFTK